MKILVIDHDQCGLPFAMRVQAAGHAVRLWQPKHSPVGQGIVERVPEWTPSMRWADLIVLTDNSKGLQALAPWFKRGFPIFGCNPQAARLELDRQYGAEAMAAAGIETLPSREFKSYDKAIDFVRASGTNWVSKPWGGNPDKTLSFVPKTPADLIVKLMKWREMQGKATREFILQECVEDGVEMAVGGWFGPAGWASVINENWEEKRLMAGGLGPNIGEAGTIMRYVRKSRLFDLVLEPLGEKLHDLGYVGYVDVNCLIDRDGTPWPLEITIRFGWPHFNLCMTLHEGDPAEWMLDLLEGRDTLKCSSDIAVGVVMTQGDFPWNRQPPEGSIGYPISGMKIRDRFKTHLCDVMRGRAPVMDKTHIVEREAYLTAGNYVMVAVGTGGNVEAARTDAYRIVEGISWAADIGYREDIGCRLDGVLGKLQRLGFAEGMRYGKG